ncbi:hypothetical protein ACFSKI_14895 [Pseudogracilibacillus auburnensis]|uniref:hypothetical protein n=1 Tax=Pseudogracilibacillus auburnensis TaxID=1494959 RepID=UPI000D774A78
MVKVWMDALFLIVIVYFALRLVSLLLKMKQNVLLPASEKEAAQIRNHPEKIVDLPNYSNQKCRFIVHWIYLLFIFTIFILTFLFDFSNWALYWLFIPLFLYSNNSFNLFAITEAGILTGTRFASWKK